MTDEHRLPPTRQDLVRWSEALAAIARTGLGFTQSLYEQERFEEVLHIAGDIRASIAADAELDVEHYVDEWMRNVGEGVAGYVTPKSAIGAVVLRRPGPDPARAAGRLRRVAVPDRLGRRRLLAGRGGGEGGAARRPASSACPRASIAVLDGMRMGITRIPLYSTVFLCRATGGELAGPPARDARRRLVRRGRAPRVDDRRRSSGAPHAFAAIRGEPLPVLFDPPRANPWHPCVGSPPCDETAIEIAESVRAGERKAVEVLDACLAEVAAGNERAERLRPPRRGPGARRRRAPSTPPSPAATTRARSPACPSA